MKKFSFSRKFISSRLLKRPLRGEVFRLLQKLSPINRGREKKQLLASSCVRPYASGWILPDGLSCGISYSKCFGGATQLMTYSILYIHGSVHRNFILISSNKLQYYAGIYLLQNQSTCFGCPSHPSSGVHKTVTAASGIDHTVSKRVWTKRNITQKGNVKTSRWPVDTIV